MGVWVTVGARDESPDESGISHFIEHMIFKGTARRSAFEIAKAFDVIGGHTNAFTAMETTCYHARVMDTHLDTMADILCDVLRHSVFDPREVERERPVIFQEIGMVEDSPEEYVHFLSENAYWGDHPLGRSVLGTRENVVRIDATAIRDFFSRCYRPDRIVIAAAGNLRHDRFLDLVAPAFQSIPAAAAPSPRIPPASHPGVTALPRDLEQVHLCIEAPGLSITDPRRFSFSLLNTILGGNMSSRLFQEIRERRGLAYSVYSFLSTYVDVGLFGVYTAVDPGNAHEAASRILDELRDLAETPVDPETLADAKEYTKGCLFLSAESIDNQMVRLAQNEIHFGRFFTLDEVVARIEAVTPADILTLSRDLFRGDRMALTLLGPADDADYPALLAS